MTVYLKCQFCLGPKLNTYIQNFRLKIKKSSVFYEFDDRHISFLDVLDLFLLTCNQNTLGYYFSDRWCWQKNHVFLRKGKVINSNGIILCHESEYINQKKKKKKKKEKSLFPKFQLIQVMHYYMWVIAPIDYCVK